MSNEIQEKDAVRIIEWLGLPWSHGTGIELPDGRYVSMDWLSSPEGEVAMMDGLSPYNAIFFDVELSSGPNKYEVEIQPFVDVAGRDNYRAVAPTRNEALQLAILEMLGKRGSDG